MPLYTCSKNKISGITLVEVMIGLVVTAVITISVYASYAAVNRSYEHVNRLSSVDQNSNKIFYLLGQDFKKIEYIEYGDVNILQSNHPSFTISAVSGSTVFDNIDIIYVENDLIYKSQYSITIADDTTTLTKSVTKLDVAVGTWAVDAADDLTHSPMMISRSLTKFKFKIINEKGEIISQPTTRSALLSAQIKVISLEAEQIIRKDNSNLTKTDLASATFFLKNLIYD
jgi:hypothetical protein|tara:strand:+ start:2227 stop:2910 length:684 start_codon:yes stop_codon:yes gene_type:complete